MTDRRTDRYRMTAIAALTHSIARQKITKPIAACLLNHPALQSQAYRTPPVLQNTAKKPFGRSSKQTLVAYKHFNIMCIQSARRNLRFKLQFQRCIDRGDRGKHWLQKIATKNTSGLYTCCVICCAIVCAGLTAADESETPFFV